MTTSLRSLSYQSDPAASILPCDWLLATQPKAGAIGCGTSCLGGLAFPEEKLGAPRGSKRCSELPELPSPRDIFCKEHPAGEAPGRLPVGQCTCTQAVPAIAWPTSQPHSVMAEWGPGAPQGTRHLDLEPEEGVVPGRLALAISLPVLGAGKWLGGWREEKW